jgi:hypothetical protein
MKIASRQGFEGHHYRPAALFVPLLLAACHVEYQPRYSDYAVMSAYVAEQRAVLAPQTDIQVRVYGDPFAPSGGATMDAIVRTMTGSNTIPGRFTANAAGKSPLYVIWDFTPAAGSTPPNRFCRLDGNPSPAPRTGGQIEAYAVLCRGGDALTSVRVDLYAAVGPDAPGFRTLVAGATRRLFPADPRIDRESGDERLADSGYRARGR